MGGIAKHAVSLGVSTMLGGGIPGLIGGMVAGQIVGDMGGGGGKGGPVPNSYGTDASGWNGGIDAFGIHNVNRDAMGIPTPRRDAFGIPVATRGNNNNKPAPKKSSPTASTASTALTANEELRKRVGLTTVLGG